MKISTYRDELNEFFCREEKIIPRRSLLSDARGEIMEMAHCYMDDGDQFFKNGDQVNALACYAYASGWIDTGWYTGLFDKKSPCRGLLTNTVSIPGNLLDQLKEKSLRYERLLVSAIRSCFPVAEPGIIWYEGGVRIIMVARTYLNGGKWLQQTGNYDDALASFSYGHGWLDASLRIGLIRITGNKELFAI
jgi:uncharacterized protein